MWHAGAWSFTTTDIFDKMASSGKQPKLVHLSDKLWIGDRQSLIKGSVNFVGFRSFYICTVGSREFHIVSIQVDDSAVCSE